MQDWIAIKEALVAWTGLDRDALQILAGFVLFLVFALIWRRPLASLAPYLSIAAIALLDEGMTGFADGAFERSDLPKAGWDALVILFVPTALMLFCRFAPEWAAPRRETRSIFLPISTSRYAPPVDAEYEEIGPEPQAR